MKFCIWTTEKFNMVCRANRERIGPEVSRGSMTVFLGMTVMLVLSLIFSMTEVTRYLALSRTADSISQIAVDNVFSEYNSILWKKYGVLGVDVYYGKETNALTERLSGFIDENGNPSDGETNLIRITSGACNVKEYSLLTDQGGAAFIKQAVQKELTDIPKEYIQDLTNQNEEIQKGEELGGVTNDLIEGGENALVESNTRDNADSTELQQSQVYTVGAGEQGNLSSSTSVEQNSLANNSSTATSGSESLITDVSTAQKSFVLDQVLSADSSLSGKALNVVDRVSTRTLETGNSENPVHANAAEKVLFQEFVLDKLGSYTDPGTSSLSYGAEYVIAGKDSDQENLTAVVERLLLIREGENLVALSQDTARQQEAETLALVIAILAQNPEIADSLKLAILAAWAYVESLMDLRTLLSGGKISLVKSSEEWTSSLFDAVFEITGSKKAKECANGLSYNDYLKSLLLLTGSEKMALRSMDLIETEIRVNEDYTNFRMDHCIYKLNAEITFVANPLFLSFIPLFDGSSLNEYSYLRSKEFSYL